MDHVGGFELGGTTMGGKIRRTTFDANRSGRVQEESSIAKLDDSRFRHGSTSLGIDCKETCKATTRSHHDYVQGFVSVSSRSVSGELRLVGQVVEGTFVLTSSLARLLY